MFEHLVEGHLGSYYISDADPEFIEQYCEECGDSDTILTSWNSEEDNARLNALLKYFLSDVLNNRDAIYKKASEISFESQWFGIDIISLLLEDIEYNHENIESIISDLHDNKWISDEEYIKIMYISTIEEERQTKMVKYFEDSMFTTDSKTGEKKLILENKQFNNNKNHK